MHGQRSVFSPRFLAQKMTEDGLHRLATQLIYISYGAKPMNFKVKLRSLGRQIKAERELLRLARLAYFMSSHVKPRVILASSIAVVGQYNKRVHAPLAPEVAMDDPDTPLPIGYAEAKQVCENLMQTAFEYKSDLEATIIRIGQVSGSQSTGFWSSKEHIPALIKASQVIGAMPHSQGVIFERGALKVDPADGYLVTVLDSGGPSCSNCYGTHAWIAAARTHLSS